MPATPTVNPTRAALEAAVLDLTDEQIATPSARSTGR